MWIVYVTGFAKRVLYTHLNFQFKGNVTQQVGVDLQGYRTFLSLNLSENQFQLNGITRNKI